MSVCVCVCVCVCAKHYRRAEYETRLVLRGDEDKEFSLSYNCCYTNVEAISLPYYLSIAEKRIVGFMPSQNISEM